MNFIIKYLNKHFVCWNDYAKSESALYAKLGNVYSKAVANDILYKDIQKQIRELNLELNKLKKGKK